MAPNLEEKTLKVIFIGDSNARYQYSNYICITRLTSRLSTIGVETKENILYVHDTAGSERFKSVTRQFYKETDIACLVYDVTNQDSFYHIGEWKRER
uniref:Uncharacterized protein n=1 Tax=Amphimedon queenslandica TaxID=400682 RepID=A0A1X7UVM4_AMPQE